MIGLYIWSNIGFFILNEFYKNKKVKGIIRIIHYFILIFFSFKNINLNLILITILMVEKIKITVWGCSSIGIVLILTSTLINNNIDIIFYLYSCLAYIFIYQVISGYLEKISLIEILEQKGRNELFKLQNKSERNIEKSKQNIKLARLEERNELGRKMHDKIGHIIAGSLLRLEASKIIMIKDKLKGESMIDEVIENLRNGMADIREIIHKITPLKEEIGINRIRSIFLKKLNNTGINFDVSFDGDLSIISYEVWSMAENFIVEMSTNSIKYSGGNKMNFHIDVMNKIIKIQFKDNGIGGEKIIKGYGLSKIEEEVISIGGKFIVDGKNGFNAVILINK